MTTSNGASAAFRMWSALDAVAHFLYMPTMRGRRVVAARWHHRLHLIPASMMSAVCDRYDRFLGAPDTDGDDTDLRYACVERLLESGEKAVTVSPDGFGCLHMQLWSDCIVGRPTFSCGCTPSPLWRTRGAAASGSERSGEQS